MQHCLPLFLIFFIIWLRHIEANDKYCYADDQHPYIQFATKSAYELVRATKPPSPIPSCTPVMIWATIRHGTRYPSRRSIEEMRTLLDVRDMIIRNHEEGNGELCQKDLKNLKNYTFSISPNYEYKLSTQGKDDLRYLAKRLKAQFPQVLDATYSSQRYAFYHDGSERTVESTNAFFTGLFGPDIGDVALNNSLLRSSHMCNSWVKQVKNNSETYKEYELFKKSDHMHKLMEEVDHRLGFKNNLTLDVISLLYDVCRYEKAWYISYRPPFCSVFSKENLMVLEYLEDLKYYYEYGYGNEMNTKLACPLMNDLVQRFDEVAEGTKKGTIKPIGVFYFSHTDLLIPIVTSLKLREDHEHLLHNNYEHMTRREFTTSTIDPFSANLVVAFYKCSVGEPNRVVLYLNEDIVVVRPCETALCPWSTISNLLKPTVAATDCVFGFCDSSALTTRMESLLICIVLISSYTWKLFNF